MLLWIAALVVLSPSARGDTLSGTDPAEETESGSALARSVPPSAPETSGGRTEPGEGTEAPGATSDNLWPTVRVSVEGRDGFLVHPVRFRELRTLVSETLPRTEADLSRCREDLLKTPAPVATTDRWLFPTAAGLAGLAVGVLLAVALGGA